MGKIFECIRQWFQWNIIFQHLTLSNKGYVFDRFLVVRCLSQNSKKLKVSIGILLIWPSVLRHFHCHFHHFHFHDYHFLLWSYLTLKHGPSGDSVLDHEAIQFRLASEKQSILILSIRYRQSSIELKIYDTQELFNKIDFTNTLVR